MSHKQQVSEKASSAPGQNGGHLPVPATDIVNTTQHGSPEPHGGKAQPRHISQQEAQSIPVDPDPDDPVSP